MGFRVVRSAVVITPAANQWAYLSLGARAFVPRIASVGTFCSSGAGRIAQADPASDVDGDNARVFLVNFSKGATFFCGWETLG